MNPSFFFHWGTHTNIVLTFVRNREQLATCDLTPLSTLLLYVVSNSFSLRSAVHFFGAVQLNCHVVFAHTLLFLENSAKLSLHFHSLPTCFVNALETFPRASHRKKTVKKTLTNVKWPSF